MVVGDSRIVYFFSYICLQYFNWLLFSVWSSLPYTSSPSSLRAAVTWHFGSAYFSTGPVGISYRSLTGTGGLERPRPCTPASPVVPPAAPLPPPDMQEVQIPDDSDFRSFRDQCLTTDGWLSRYTKGGVTVWSHQGEPSGSGGSGGVQKLKVGAGGGDKGYIWCCWIVDTC